MTSIMGRPQSSISSSCLLLLFAVMLLSAPAAQSAVWNEPCATQLTGRPPQSCCTEQRNVQSCFELSFPWISNLPVFPNSLPRHHHSPETLKVCKQRGHTVLWFHFTLEAYLTKPKLWLCCLISAETACEKRLQGVEEVWMSESIYNKNVTCKFNSILIILVQTLG